MKYRAEWNAGELNVSGATSGKIFGRPETEEEERYVPRKGANKK